MKFKITFSFLLSLYCLTGHSQTSNQTSLLDTSLAKKITISGFCLCQTTLPDLQKLSNDFKLIELDKNKYKRWFVTNRQNSYSTVSGVDPKSVYNLKYERLTPSLFKVILKENARSGEYCFFYAGNTAKQSSGETFYTVNQVKVFDFGIVDSEKGR